MIYCIIPETGEILEEGESYMECSEKMKKNHPELLPNDGEVAVYHYQSWKP